MYTTYLKLDLRSKVLKAKKSAKNLHLSTREAFNALFREVKNSKNFYVMSRIIEESATRKARKKV